MNQLAQQSPLAGLVRTVGRPARCALARALSKAESWLVSRQAAPLCPPVFVIGLPRVGSTLIYQSLVQGLGFSYLCNAAASFPGSPALVTHLLHHTVGIRPPPCFESRYGVSPGWRSAAQGREVWARWFPEDQSYCGPGSVAAPSLVAMRSTIASIERAFGMPFLNKAQGHAVRIRPLHEAFPRAIFVRVQREPTAVAESILRGRRDCFGDDTRWFSAKPSTYDSLLALDPSRQIAGQIMGIQADMERDLSLVGSHRVFTVDYDRFCTEPRRILADFAAFYERSTGLMLVHRSLIPAAFPSSDRARVPPTESRQMRESLGLSDTLAISTPHRITSTSS